MLFLLEHTRSTLPVLGLYQDAVSGPVQALGKGCRWNQDVGVLARAAGLRVLEENAEIMGLVSTLKLERT